MEVEREQRAGSPARVSGREFRQFEYEGVTYTLSQPQKMRSFSEQEGLVLSRRLDAMIFGQRMMASMPANYHAAIVEGCAAAAGRGIASKEEWAAYEDSLWKAAYMFWSTLDPEHTKGKNLANGVDWAVNLLYNMPMDKWGELKELIAIVSQDRAIKNSDGRTETPAPVPSL